jgi:hypothetical protein
MRPSGGATHLPASRQAICLQKKNRVKLWLAIAGMPNETRIATLHEWELLDVVERHIGELEVRIRERIGRIGWVRPLKTMPGGPTVHASGGKSHRVLSLHDRIPERKCHGKAAVAAA